MKKDNGALTVRDQQNRNVDSSEQYAINTLGDGALKSVDKLVKTGKQAAESTNPLKSSRAKPIGNLNSATTVQHPMPKESHVPTARTQLGENPKKPLVTEEWSSEANEQGHISQVEHECLSKENGNVIHLPSGNEMPADNGTLHSGQAPKTISYMNESTQASAPGERSVPRKNSSSPQENHLHVKTEPQLNTWAANPLTSTVQNQGVALAVAKDSGTTLHSASVQAVSHTAGSAGASAAANATAPGVAAVIQAAEKAVTKIKDTIENIAASAPKSNSPVGALAALFLLPLLVVAAIAGVFRGGGSVHNVGLSADVLALMPQISAACQANGIPEYTQLVAAVMMQESGGRADDVGGDVMQCAEGMGLPVGTPVSVEDSINFGTSIIAANLQAAGATGPTDIPAISLALQGYNFGNGYISWALARGGYSKENAREFSVIQAAAHGWSGYGDVDYVDHVLRYYQISAGGMGDASAIADGRFAYPFPGHTWDTYPGHNGIDISFANCYGEPVYAVAGGIVRYTQDGWTEADGVGGMWSFGNSVFVEHGDDWISAYAHLSALAVAPGETVMQGQLIGYIGSTGNSTGPHLHLALYHDGDAGIDGQCFAELAWPQYKLGPRGRHCQLNQLSPTNQ